MKMAHAFKLIYNVVVINWVSVLYFTTIYYDYFFYNESYTFIQQDNKNDLQPLFIQMQKSTLQFKYPRLEGIYNHLRAQIIRQFIPITGKRINGGKM